MKVNKIVVVGDKYSEYANGKKALTISQLEFLVKLPDNLFPDEHELVIGQGVCKHKAKKIIDYIDSNQRLKSKLKTCSVEKLVSEHKNRHTHKWDERNILIGQAEKVDHKLDMYALPLVIDDNCELMGDHQTGLHVQGMLLVEACRQAFIAVTEEFVYQKQSDKYYVINSMSIDFANFLFPLPAIVHFEFVEKDVNERRGRFKARISVTQNQTVCANMDVSFSVYSAKSIQVKEEELAKFATEVVVNASDQFYLEQDCA
ncbi:hypothetical protein KIV40_19505 [Vibrio sp. D173a]|uniref:AfsA-related hotdog domain-containing protein n=1 Tax=Vibrio sp. D173a TaxID=2836349 RepID=UPI0025575C2F|nr:AfsA-related hotdog domain-containing protein [Vibrio sp. D173a]MDK9757523.1 hypothetical protein [Vibrio sp. D173a]